MHYLTLLRHVRAVTSLTFSSLSELELFNVEPKPSSSFSKFMNEPCEPNCQAYIEPNIYHKNCNLKNYFHRMH